MAATRARTSIPGGADFKGGICAPGKATMPPKKKSKPVPREPRPAPAPATYGTFHAPVADASPEPSASVTAHVGASFADDGAVEDAWDHAFAATEIAKFSAPFDPTAELDLSEDATDSDDDDLATDLGAETEAEEASPQEVSPQDSPVAPPPRKAKRSRAAAAAAAAAAVVEVSYVDESWFV